MGKKAELKDEVRRLTEQVRYLDGLKAQFESKGRAIRQTLRAVSTNDNLNAFELDYAVSLVIKELREERTRADVDAVLWQAKACRFEAALRQARVCLAAGRTVGNDIAGMAVSAENLIAETLEGDA